MKNLILRLAVAAPLTLCGLLFPFFLSGWLKARYGYSLPLVIPLLVGGGIAYAVFFALAGKQMKQVDERWRQNNK